jgi:hypothetical protein
MRFLIALLVVTAGCVATLPGDNGITADIACETARMVVQMRQQIPPTPTPPSDGKCQNCDGRGYVGDGTVKVTCQPCGGTGREPQSVCVEGCRESR